MEKHNSPDSSNKKENNTGLPDDLKSGIEGMPGMSMHDVNVHYNEGTSNFNDNWKARNVTAIFQD